MSGDDEARRPPSAGGGMTDATGSLTPESGDEEFVPAERRAIESPAVGEAGATGHVRPPGDEPRIGGDEESGPERY